MKKTSVRFLSLLLTLCMVLGMLPMTAWAATDEAASEPTIVIAGSDFQPTDDSTVTGAQQVKALLQAIKKSYTTADGFLFCGDYDYSSTTSAYESMVGKAALQVAVQGVYGDGMDEVYIQGNHDPDSVVTNGTLASSGEHDTDDYGVYVINEKDYMWYNNDKATIKETAEALEDYLDAKREGAYTKPIFVVSHLPLHYCMRTLKGGNDGMYANYIFDVLNEAGEKGLNIIFLFGHNHSHGWDDYLGGSAIFLTKGDTINIAQASTTDYKVETLNFTYMNAGYVGYYGNTNSGADTTLTMTAFEITDSQVKITRYDTEGTHNLKSKGVYGGEYPDNQYANPVYAADETVVTGSYTLTLSTETGTEVNPPTNGSVSATTPDWVTITDSSTKTIFRLTNNQFTSGKKYLIVSTNAAGSARALSLNNNGNSLSSTIVTVIEDTSGNYIEAPGTSAQWSYTSGNKLRNVGNTNRYLYRSSSYGNQSTLGTTNSSNASSWYYSSTNGVYCNSGWNGGSYYITSSFGLSTSTSNRVYIYEEETLTVPAEYAKITGELSYTVPLGTNSAEALAAVKAGIDVVVKNNGKETTLSDDNSSITWTLNSYDGDTSGEYTVTISYKGKELGVANVIVSADIESIETVNGEGQVKQNAAKTAKVGDQLKVNLKNNTYYYVDITVDMLTNADGSPVSTAVDGTFTGLTLSYKGEVITNNYTLTVVPPNDYPLYPDEGAVKVNKTATGVDFQASGVAQVELSASGIPAKKGADVILMVDTSSSMNDEVDGQQRIDVLKESVQNMITTFQTPGEDGEVPDIRLAVAEFNGYYTAEQYENSPYYLATGDKLSDTAQTRHTSAVPAYVFTRDGEAVSNHTEIDAKSFVDVSTLSKTSFNSVLGTHSGTNYDYAFDVIYQLGYAITQANEENGEERDLFVIFMSDGAPFQFNYYGGYSTSSSWNDWLQGTLEENNKLNLLAGNTDYYNKDGKQWMAEAIKGDPNESYPVIRKSTDGLANAMTAIAGKENMYNVPGLGATMYSIGFCLAKDKQITVKSMQLVLKNIASGDSTYYDVDTADGLKTAFSQISSEILYAATQARFVDTMSDSFELVLGSRSYETSDGETKTIAPTIEVKSYEIWTRADYEAGKCSENQIGVRKTNSDGSYIYTVLETVTFNADGTEAYSNQINTGNTNILTGGVICAKNFWYNTTDKTVTVTTELGNYELAAESFYWNLGTITTKEIALSYYVYLSDALDDDGDNHAVAAGSYATNASAILYYTNYRGTENCYKTTVSPVMAWQGANLSVAFYLVDQDGNILTSMNGTVGTFANKRAVTDPVLYASVDLNSTGEAQSLTVAAASVLPEEYEIYDTDASYAVTINSNGTGSWLISKGEGRAATTYITGFNGDAYSNELNVSDPSYDYTHTIVWFAVTYRPGCKSDTVVIDYGLPVDIHVLYNDFFSSSLGVELLGVGSISAKGDDGDTTAPEGFVTEANTQYASVAVNEGKATSKNDAAIRYTLNNANGMLMGGPESFAYAVKYMGKYYYGDVTVIPATTVYFEENFVTFTNAKDGNGEELDAATSSGCGIWVAETDLSYMGSTDTQTAADVTQAEDRPGEFSLSYIDADNIYGFDPAYSSYSKFSLGKACKVTVDAETGNPNTAPEVNFSFKGTGFDVISLTDNRSGVIQLTLTDSEKKIKKVIRVDNYYGYTQDDEGNWVVDENATDALWQVPVIKVEGLDYGTYDVKIQVAYMPIADHQEQGSYSFWLDAIRIYDPAQNDETANDAYAQDGEYAPQYVEVRDLLLAQTDLETSVDTVEGVVFIDGADGNFEIRNYEKYGPKNEVYLAAEQGVSFYLQATAIPASVQIGAKLASGTSATLRVNSTFSITLNTATDMYYELPNLTWTKLDSGVYQSNMLVLSNGERKTLAVSDTIDAANVISITNIKTTFEPDAATTAEYSVIPVVDALVLEQAPALMSTLYTPVVEDTPETPTPEEPEDQPVEEGNPFQPEAFRTYWRAGRVDGFSTLTVMTSDDVEAIRVDGELITSYYRTPMLSFTGRGIELIYGRVFTFRTVADHVGTYNYDVVAYDADGLASDVYKTTLTVVRQ